MKLIYRLSVLVLLASLLVFSLLNRKEQNEIQIRSATKKIVARPVTVKKVTMEQFTQTLEVSGKVESSDQAFIISTVNGVIQSVNVSAGSYVRKGDVLATIDDYYLRKQYELAKEAYDQDQRDLERIINLAETDAITGQQKEQFKLKAEASKTRMELALKRLEETKIVATLEGTVNQVFIKSGNSIGLGRPVCEIIGTKQLIIKTGIQEEYLNKVNIGDTVQLFDFGSPYATFATILNKGIQPDFLGKIPVDVRFQPTPDLYQGKLVDVRFEIKGTEGILLPVEAMLLDQNTDQVMIEKEGKAVFQPVRIGNRLGNNVVVLEGLEINDKVIIDGNHLLKQGDSLNVIEYLQ